MTTKALEVKINKMTIASISQGFGEARTCALCCWKANCYQLENHLELSPCAWLCPTLCNPKECSHQAPLSMEFCRQEYWSRVPFPSPEDLPQTGIEPTSLVSPALAGGFFITSAIWEAHGYCFVLVFYFFLLSKFST